MVEVLPIIVPWSSIAENGMDASRKLRIIASV